MSDAHLLLFRAYDYRHDDIGADANRTSGGNCNGGSIGTTHYLVTASRTGTHCAGSSMELHVRQRLA
ncbi:hypothetical protein CF335_g6806 [Tilletia laevis]|nr:hypothetical protein CF335_g6806 [Tilletia laevis]